MDYFQKIIDTANQNLVGKELFDEYIVMSFDVVNYNYSYDIVSITILNKSKNISFTLTQAVFNINFRNCCQLYFYIFQDSFNIGFFPPHYYNKSRGHYIYKFNNGELYYDDK